MVLVVDGCDDDGHNTGNFPMGSVHTTSQQLAKDYADTIRVLSDREPVQPVLPFVPRA